MRQAISYVTFCSCVFVVLVAALAGAGSKKADFYVATTGNDNWSGRLAGPNPDATDGPFATLAKARDAVRQLKNRSIRKDIVVLVRGGTYYLKETVVFGLQDSAKEGQTITYAACPGEEPVFSSGVRITGWKELGADRPDELSEWAQGNVWVADVPSTLGRFYTLYDGDRRLPRARSAGFAPTEPTILWNRNTNFWQSGDPELARILSFPKGALRDWPNLEDVEILVRPCWPFVLNILGLESVDERTRIARTTIGGSYPLRKMARGRGDQSRSVWVENVLEALDSPGEWVLNTEENRPYLWPREDSPGDEILAPCLRELVKVEGDIDFDGPVDKPVRGLVFRGLAFTQADRGVWTKDDATIQHDWEVADNDDALVRLRGAENCVIQHCRFFNSGGSAVRLDLHCQRNKIIGNEISHLGGAGVLLIGYGPGTKDVNKHNEVVNNHIHHCGQIWWHSHGIVLWQSGENRVANNYIHHMPRKGICLAGVRVWFFHPDRPVVRECAKSIRWHEIGKRPKFPKVAVDFQPGKVLSGYQPGAEWDRIMPYLHTRNNIIEYNEVYRVGQIMGDGSAINVSGAGEGNVIRRNYVHHIFNERLHVAIRTDDIQRGTLIEENVIFRCRCGGLCLRHENYAVNNIIVDVEPDNYIWTDDRWPLDGSRIVGNIFYHPGQEQEFFEMPEWGPVFSGRWAI